MENDDEETGSQAKRQRTTAAEDASAAVHSSASSAAAPRQSVDVVWEWEGDSGKWQAYSDEHQEVLSTGFATPDVVVVLSVPNTPVKLAVNFQRMVQANKRTGWERCVRCREKAVDGNGESSRCDSFGQKLSWKRSIGIAYIFNF